MNVFHQYFRLGEYEFDMADKKLGIIGGFGGYATLDFFRRILEKFQTDTERSYPHIIMDNNFKMPSRTRALLYGDNYQEIVMEMATSMERLLKLDVDAIVLPCGTAHAFLPDVYQLVPEAEEKVIHIIRELGKGMQRCKIKKCLVLAAEGTLKQHVYANSLSSYSIDCVEPGSGDYATIRYFIESVKSGGDSRPKLNEAFLDFLEKFAIENVVLGCTELPVLVQRLHIAQPIKFFDPLEYAIDSIYQIFRM